MIKYLLISGVLSLNVTYPNIDVCKEALTQVVKHDESNLYTCWRRSSIDENGKHDG